jgi:hypothetical protein
MCLALLPHRTLAELNLPYTYREVVDKVETCGLVPFIGNVKTVTQHVTGFLTGHFIFFT